MIRSVMVLSAAIFDPLDLLIRHAFAAINFVALGVVPAFAGRRGVGGVRGTRQQRGG